MNCPSENRLLEFIDGVLAHNDTEAIDAHVDQCPDCCSLLAACARTERSADTPADSDEAGPAQITLAPNGRYRFTEVLGTGAAGVVYAAHDNELDRVVAIKVVKASADDQEQWATAYARLRREAQAMARLSHPNVLPVYDVDRVNGRLFIVTEFVDGTTLDRWIADQHGHWRPAVELLLQAADGLVASHAAGVIHRDFKPSNVLIGTDGRVRVADFGLVRPPSEPPRDGLPPSTDNTPLELTRTGTIVGTPAYLAPELFAGQEADAHSDQFAFCVTLYRALYGEPPFPATTLTELAEQVGSGAAPTPPTTPVVPLWLRAAVLTGLRREPHERHPCMAALATALRTGLHRRKNQRRTRWLMGAASVCALGLAVAVLSDRADRADRCGTNAQQLAGIWDDTTAAQILASAQATGKSYATAAATRIIRRLDAYKQNWVDMGQESCRATYERGSQSEQLLDLRSSCLDRRRGELTETSQLLAQAFESGDVSRVDELAAGLTPIAHCADRDSLTSSALPPLDKATRELIAQIDRAAALFRAGHYEQGLTVADQAAQALSTQGHPAVLAEALIVLAQLQQARGSTLQAQQTYRRAIRAAAAGTDQQLAARCWLDLAHTMVDTMSAKELDVVLSAAESSVIAAGSPSQLQLRLHNVRAAAYTVQGKLDEARSELELAITLAQQLPTERNELADLLNNLGAVLERLGDTHQADRQFSKALEVAEAQLGPDHPYIARYLNNLGRNLLSMGQVAPACKHLERALAIRRATLPATHAKVAESLIGFGLALAARGDLPRAELLLTQALPIVRATTSGPPRRLAAALIELGNIQYQRGELDAAHATLTEALQLQLAANSDTTSQQGYTLNSLASIARDRGDYDAALDYFQQSLAQRRSAYGAEHPDSAVPLLNIGDLYREQGNCTVALDYFQQALDLWNRSLSPPQPYLAYAMANIGGCRLELGEAARAIPSLESALTITTQVELSPAVVAEIEFTLARARWDANRDRDRARTLATAAHQRAGTAGANELATEIANWRSDHL